MQANEILDGEISWLGLIQIGHRREPGPYLFGSGPVSAGMRVLALARVSLPKSTRVAGPAPVSTWGQVAVRI
jgi:hypothetical protein